MAVGGYNEDLHYAEDFDLWLRISDAGGKFDFTVEPLYFYRRRADSNTQGMIGVYESLVQIYSTYLSHANPAIRAVAEEKVEATKAQLALEKARSLILAGSYSYARATIQAVNSHFKRRKLAFVAFLLRIFPFSVRWALRRAHLRQQARFS